MTVANGLLFVGRLAASEVAVYETATGTQVATLPVPEGGVYGGAAIDSGVVYIPWGDAFAGSSGKGGVVAYELPAP